ncbi:MAG: chemotaxis protein CheC [Euryarchaeota archaeon]|nr:chemotaxis protein CheC [Euryarchaeota archaeon]
MIGMETLKGLKKLGDQSAEMAVRSLAEMTGMQVLMEVSAVNLTEIEQIPAVIGITEDAMVGLYVRFSGELPGSVLTLLSIPSAQRLADIMLAGMEDEADGDSVLSEMQQSAVEEIGNIITSSFIDVWANAFSMGLNQSPPAFVCDYVISIIDAVLAKASEKGDFAVVFNSAIYITDQDIDCHVLVLPDPDRMQMMFDNLV